LLKNMLAECQCVFSGEGLEIEPYAAPLDAFGSYWNASHKVFMSATVTDDAFLVKGFRLSSNTISTPISYERETWSGEKMIVIPSLINDGLDREVIVRVFGNHQADRQYGIVSLTPSFARAEDWKNKGSTVATKDTLEDLIDSLKSGKYSNTIVLANRYDGVDLPDNSCRILVLDSKPYSSRLIDVYEESCRPRSDITFMRTVRTVEQGMGRSVRGEKDYSIILVVGADLVRLVREKRSRAFLSSQMETQIKVGLELAEMARQEIEEGSAPWDAFIDLLRQSLRRDPDWKAFYTEQMDGVKPKGANIQLLKLYEAELAAEEAFSRGEHASAVKIIQKALDEGLAPKEDKGWYLQLMARLLFPHDQLEAENLQVKAHKQNRMLLRPSEGVSVSQLSAISHKRVAQINKWISDFGSYQEMNVAVSDVLAALVFGIKADRFERALDELGRALGFATERPDKEWKEGPDNLWALDQSRYLLWECKNEVKLTRVEINKSEAEQMNRSSAWFAKHYKGVDVKRVIVHPSNVVASAAAFTHDVVAMREKELRSFKAACREFFSSFEAQDFGSLSETKTQELLDVHGLSVQVLIDAYGKKLKDVRAL
jgi:replicative superfamily II helicase